MALVTSLVAVLDRKLPYPTLRDRVLRGAMALLDAVTLATHGIDRWQHLRESDARLSTLRANLQVALDVGLLSPGYAFSVMEQVDLIGRQLGGWLRKVRPGSVGTAPAER